MACRRKGSVESLPVPGLFRKTQLEFQHVTTRGEQSATQLDLIPHQQKTRTRGESRSEKPFRFAFHNPTEGVEEEED